jgi:cobalamin biosynthesis Mg chelatase CobN
MLALLAFAVSPGLAQAEEASGIQYEPDVPTVPGKQKIPTKEKKSNSGEPEAGSSKSPTGGGSGGGNHPGGGGTGNTGQGNQGGGTGGTQAGGGGQNSGGQNGGGQNPSTTNVSSGAPAGSESSGGSSSPLVPILIAIAALAAISIGAVVYRQRRGRGGSSVSPKAS